MAVLENTVDQKAAASDQLIATPDQKETSLAEEKIAAYAQDGMKSLMWLSSYMKRWLSDYVVAVRGAKPGEIDEEATIFAVKQKVESQSPVPQVKKIRTMLHLFVSMLRLATFQQDKQQEIIDKWEKTKAKIDASDEYDYFSVYQSLTADEMIDAEEFKGLAREFVHDIDTAGLSALDGAFDEQYMVIPESDTPQLKTEIWRNIRAIFDTDITRDAGQTAAKILHKLEARGGIDSELTALAVIKMYEVLYAFNLETGGVAYEPAVTSVSVDYIRNAVGRAQSEYPFTISLDLKVDQAAKQKQTYLNKAALVRFLTNGFSNSKRIGATEVQIQCRLTTDALTVALSDNGSGFPNVSKKTANVLGNQVQLFEVSLGKTYWKNAVGTGTGLYGLNNMMKSIGGELVVGNRIENGNTIGGITAVRALVT